MELEQYLKVCKGTKKHRIEKIITLSEGQHSNGQNVEDYNTKKEIIRNRREGINQLFGETVQRKTRYYNSSQGS
jgi:hypothetical protein